MNDDRKYIKENRDIFDNKEPSPGHIERFEALLDKQEAENRAHKPTKRIRLVTIMSVAASIAILVGVAVKFYNPASINAAPPSENSLASDEFLTTNDYYNERMKEEIADIMCKLNDTDSENQAQLTEDIQKIVENNSAFVDEMARNENQDVAIRYLVKHYRTNIQRLESINEKLGKHAKC